MCLQISFSTRMPPLGVRAAPFSITPHVACGRMWKSALHINLLVLGAVWQALLHFQQLLQGKTVGVFADNTTALAYLSHQGGTRSSILNNEVQRTLRWAVSRSITIGIQFISGTRNVVEDSLIRRHQVLSTEWTLHHEVC